jgi:hypothetical protein
MSVEEGIKALREDPHLEAAKKFLVEEGHVFTEDKRLIQLRTLIEYDRQSEIYRAEDCVDSQVAVPSIGASVFKSTIDPLDAIFGTIGVKLCGPSKDYLIRKYFIECDDDFMVNCAFLTGTLILLEIYADYPIFECEKTYKLRLTVTTRGYKEPSIIFVIGELYYYIGRVTVEYLKDTIIERYGDDRASNYLRYCLDDYGFTKYEPLIDAIDSITN